MYRIRTGIACALAVLAAGAAQGAHAQGKDPNYARNLAAACFTCHGTDGRSVGGVPPSLAGQERNHLLQALKDFKAGKRPATIMHQQAKGYTDEELEVLADYFSRAKAGPAPAAR
jgi:sulfide dehydrogenase cytochrome subunit